MGRSHAVPRGLGAVLGRAGTRTAGRAKLDGVRSQQSGRLPALPVGLAGERWCNETLQRVDHSRPLTRTVPIRRRN